MTLSDLAALGSFVSGVAILVSLVFLYFQLRQVYAQIRLAERNQQATIQQDRYGRVFEVNLAMTEPTLADAVAKGTVGARDLSPTQFTQFRAYCSARFQISENTFLQHKAGLLNDEAFAAFLNGFVAAFHAPSIRVMWKWQRPFHAAEFAAFVDALVEKTPLVKPVDLAAQWDADLVAEEARVTR